MPAVNLTRALLDENLEAGRGEAMAVREPKRAWSYARLADEAGRVGNALASQGVQPGDRVALMLHDSLEAAAVFLGAARIGALPVPVPTLLRALDVRAILADARPKVAVVHADLAPLADEVCEELPAPPDVVVVASAGGPSTEHPELIELVAQADTRCPPRDGDEPTMLLYSGGASEAKGVPHGAAGVLAAFQAWGRNVIDLQPSDRLLATSKLTSAYGLGAGLLFPLAAGATTCLIPERARPRAVFQGLTHFHPTVFCATPSLYAQMLHDFQELTAPRLVSFEGVRAAVSGAEPLTAELYRRIESTFHVPLVHGFGSTEALHFVLSARLGETRPGSAGRPLEGYQARVVDDAGHELKVEEIGRLEVRGPSVASSYWGRAEESKRTFRDGWLRTGDRFFRDADGWFFHCGRVDDLFKVGGKWVAPTEVEQTLLAHPAVWECAVVGQEDTDGLTVPVAYVVTNVGHEPTHELGRELMEFVKREIAPYKYPRRVEFIAELPKNPQGKVLRWRLRQAHP
jgi:benzoate-CoA ligase